MTQLKKVFSRTAVVVALITVLGTIVVAVIQNLNKPSPDKNLDSRQYVGRILDNATQLPISNAKVTLDLPGMIPQIAYTDNEGVYFYNLTLKEGQQNGLVSVDAAGYETYRRNISLSASVLTIEDIRLFPTSTINNSTNTTEPTSTLTPSETPKPALSNAIIVMNNFYSWINNSGNKDDLLRSWNLETSGINGFQCREAAGCDFAKFRDTWWQWKVQYKLYDCGSNLVDAELRYYKRDPLLASTPTAPTYARYQLVEVNGELKINKGEVIEGPGADCKLEVSVP